MHESPVHSAVHTYAASVGDDFDRCALGYAAGKALQLSGDDLGALHAWLDALDAPHARGWPVLMNAIHATALELGCAREVQRRLDARSEALEELHLWSGLLSRHLGETDRAIASFQRAAQGTDELAFTATTELMRSLSESGRHPEALAACDAALSRRLPGELLLRATRGGLLNRLQRPAEALEELDAVLEQAPGLAAAWLNRGSARLRLGQPGALADLQRATQLDPALHPHAAQLREELA